MNVNPLAGLPQGVLPIATGRGDDAMRRKAAEATGQALTAQFVQGTETAVPHVNVSVESGMAIAQGAQPTVAPISIPQVNHMELTEVKVDVKPFKEYEDSTKVAAYALTDAVTLQVTQEIVYDHHLELDWTRVNERVKFVFVARSGKIIGCTDKPKYDEELEDFVMETGQYMTIGEAAVDQQRTTFLTLTERPAVVKQKDELIDVNPVAGQEPEEVPYYHNWGRARRRKERNKLRGMGKPVPADL